jgi:hypothetical protein
MVVISRESAKSLGLKRYFTGKPCKYGHMSERLVSDKKCVTCKKVHLADWKSRNKDHIQNYNAEKYRGMSDEVRERSRLWRQNNPERFRELTKSWVHRNREHVNTLRRERRKRPDVQEKEKAYRASVRLISTNRHRERRHQDPYFKFMHNMRNRIRRTIEKNNKDITAQKLLGCSVSHAISYIEAQFAPGMTWHNWGASGWHIDHIKPLSSFDMSDPNQIRQAFHYTNLQPLWARENLQKWAH